MSWNRHVRTVGRRFGWTIALVVILAVPIAHAQQRAVIGEGEVTANDVYVRSGPSMNHYTICKLGAGDRVKLLGQRGEWWEILPPDQAYSLISGEYVDTVDNKSGVVNGNNVRVRAGSMLNNNKYTVQTMLKKGAEVTIVGQEPDGFLRIVPPTGATLWINEKFVEPVPDELTRQQQTADPAIEQPSEPATSVVAESTGPDAAATEKVAEASETPDSPFVDLPLTEERQELEKLDVATREEAAKPLLERRFDDYLKGYKRISEQSEDEIAQRYARLRIQQIERMSELADSVRKIRNLGEQTESKRREYLAKRMTLPKMSPLRPSGLDAEGELRESALYPPGSDPRRYRLIDAQEPGVRTIGYVEIPYESTIDVESFLGRYVGVRASKTHLLSGSVDPLPIYLASELVLVQPGTGSEDMAQ
ncbi:MAG: hypothetical protein JSU63_19335 [Phycisphaerales bacterium]|nr:MAG: hypothetical protein JSU63_19335 [Phycisphaerales bacterium]